MIGGGNKPFIIAEMSGNHNQDLDKALEIVDIAAESGAHCIKLQTYTAESLTLDIDTEDFIVRDQASPWFGRRLFELYQEAHTPWEWHKPIIERARSRGIECFSSPFDERAVDFLEELGVSAYKIASFENNHLPLIHKAASTGKPLLISTGMATIGEIEKAVEVARNAGCNKIALLKCTSSYPASPTEANISTIPHMKELFKCEVGLSDHTLGIGVAVASVAMGASIIEKHFTIRRADGGVDSQFSLEPKEMSDLVKESTRAWESLGKISYGASAKEQKSRVFRRSIYVAENISRDEVFTSRNLRIVRPGYGAEPEFLEYLLGKKSPRKLAKGQALRIEDLL